MKDLINELKAWFEKSEISDYVVQDEKNEWDEILTRARSRCEGQEPEPPQDEYPHTEDNVKDVRADQFPVPQERLITLLNDAHSAMDGLMGDTDGDDDPNVELCQRILKMVEALSRYSHKEQGREDKI